MIVRSVGKPEPSLAATAACVADEARAARDVLGAGCPAEDLVEITTVTGSRLHVSRLLRSSPSAPGPEVILIEMTATIGSRLHMSRLLRSSPNDGLLLFVDLERAKSNLGLATLRVGQLAPAVLA